MIRLTILTLPVSVNRLERMHWAVKKKLRRKLGIEIFDAWYESGSYAVLQTDFLRPCQRILRTTIYWKTRRLDEDNLVGSLKVHIDAMRDIRLIYRDSPKWLTVEKPIQKIDRENPRVEIELEELS